MCTITDENSRALRKTAPLQARKEWDFHHGNEDRKGRKQNSTRTEASMKDQGGRRKNNQQNELMISRNENCV